MKTYDIKLIPISSFHSFPTSDTLFGAICWGIKRLYGEEKLLKILNQFDTDSLPFLISSAFPLLENSQGDLLSFYPKPISTGLRSNDIDILANKLSNGNFKKSQVKVITEYKKYKKADYISEALLKDMILKKSDKDIFEEYLLSDEIVVISGLLMKKSEIEKIFNGIVPEIFKLTTVQKNSIDRLSMSTGEVGQTFYQQEIYSSNCFRLHFLIETSDIDFLIPIFRYLEDEGIGGNRSTGKSMYRIEVIGEKELPSSNNNVFMTLSRFIPLPSEVNWNNEIACYEIFPYRSKIDSDGEFMDENENIWKNKVMYLKEGSIFKANERKEYYGYCPVVKEIQGQKIRQNGVAFPVFGCFGGVK